MQRREQGDKIRHAKEEKKTQKYGKEKTSEPRFRANSGGSRTDRRPQSGTAKRARAEEQSQIKKGYYAPRGPRDVLLCVVSSSRRVRQSTARRARASDTATSAAPGGTKGL